MRKFQIIKEEVTKRVPSDVVCNKCGKSKELEGDDFNREFGASKFQSINISFGYGSAHDGDDWKFDLCEECLEEFVKTFVHMPDGVL
jgi:hypothetical protein